MSDQNENINEAEVTEVATSAGESATAPTVENEVEETGIGDESVSVDSAEEPVVEEPTESNETDVLNTIPSTSEVTQDNKPVEKSSAFLMNDGKNFKIIKDVLSFELFKRLTVVFNPELDVKRNVSEEDRSAIAAELTRRCRAMLKSLYINDVEYDNINERKSSGDTVLCVWIPYVSKMTVALEYLIETIRSYKPFGADVKTKNGADFCIRIESIVRATYNTKSVVNTEDPESVYVKGVSMVSTARATDGKSRHIVGLKSSVFMNRDMGYGTRDMNDLSRHILTIVRAGMFGKETDPYDRTPEKTVINMRFADEFDIFLYEFDGFEENDDNKCYLVTRYRTHVRMHYRPVGVDMKRTIVGITVNTRPYVDRMKVKCMDELYNGVSHFTEENIIDHFVAAGSPYVQRVAVDNKQIDKNVLDVVAHEE